MADAAVEADATAAAAEGDEGLGDRSAGEKKGMRLDGSRDGLCLRMVRQKGNAKEIAGAHLNVDGSRQVLAGARV